MRKRDRLFKSYCQETNPTVNLIKHNNYKKFEIWYCLKEKNLKNSFIKSIFKEIQKISNKLGVAENEF